MASGRGSWTTTGKANKARQYKLIPGLPLDGLTPNRGIAYRAVNLGVRAIQTAVNAEGYPAVLDVDGMYGPMTEAGVKWFQSEHGLSADGVAGAETCLRLWHQAVMDAADESGVYAKILYGQMLNESSGDPGACGYHHEPDRGLVQINTAMFTGISLAEAHDTVFALRWSAKLLRASLVKYADKPDIAMDCAVLAHKSPAGAATLYRTGDYPNPDHKTYVDAIRRDADLWSA